MINKKYLLALSGLLVLSLISGLLIDQAHFKFFVLSTLVLSAITFLFYFGSKFSLIFEKNYVFLLLVASGFFIKIIVTILFFVFMKKNYFYTRAWAAHYFVFYNLFSFTASIFISNKKEISNTLDDEH